MQRRANFMRRGIIFLSATMLLPQISDAAADDSASPRGATVKAPATPPASEATAEPPLRDPSVLVRLMRSDAVQRELGLSSGQRDSIDKWVDEVGYPLFVVRDLPAADKRERVNATADKVEASLRQTLKDKQHQRLFEIAFRAEGWPALLAPQSTAALKLSDEQTKAIRAALEESAAAAAASSTSKSPSAEDRIMKLLKSEQKDELARLAGSPFDFSRVPQVACRAPELRDVTDWLNTEPVTLEGLRGRVIVLHFFAFGCINCVHNQPHYQEWQERFADKPVTILGIHTPETKREHEVKNLAADVRKKKITWPIAVDNKSSNWEAWGNHIWPAVYLIDRRGYVRYWWYGELDWEGAGGQEVMRKRIDELLGEKS